jgi:hypothetical protein
LAHRSPQTVLDEEKLETLRRWGDGLTRDEREEVAAAGRAILMLVEEVERLHVDLWNATRLFPQEQQQGTDAHTPRAEPASAAQTLFERLKEGARHADEGRSD